MKPLFYITHYIIAYDIADNKRCIKVNNILRGYCFQQQRSVFEGELTQAQFRTLKKKLLSVIDRKKDSIIIYPLAKQNIFSKEVYGKLPYEIRRIF